MHKPQRSGEFLKAQKQNGGLLQLAIALGSMGGLLIVVQAWCLAHIVNAVIFDGQNLAAVQPYLVTILLLILFRVAVSYASEVIAFSATAKIKQNIRERLLAKMQSLGPAYMTGQHSGELSTTLIDGVEALENYYARYLPAMALAGWVPLIILVFVIPFDWKSALVMLLTAPLIPLFMVFIGKGAEKLNQKQFQRLTRMGGHFLDVIQGLLTLKLFNASKREAAVVEQMSEDYREATMKVLRMAFLSSLALEFFATVSIAIVAVLIGFRLLFGEMSFESGFFILLLAPEFYLPLRSLGVHYHGRMEAIASTEKILQILQTPSVVSLKRTQSVQAGPLAIQIRQLSFQYAQRPALNLVNFDITAGEHVALVGPSGSGKTTLVNLLLGFMQAEQGSILINNQNLNQIDLQSWRQRIAWVPQRPHIYFGTVLQNLTLGLKTIDQHCVIEALEKSHALEFVEQLPQGLDTIIGEGGQGLSGGQVQRLAIARALLRDADFLLLDEPTAHLDKTSEQRVEAAIQTLAKGRTVLSVAHRLSTIQQADRIVVLDQGTVVEQGRHSRLVTQNGLYQQLVTAYGVSG